MLFLLICLEKENNLSFSNVEENIIKESLGKDLISIKEHCGDLFLTAKTSSITRIMTILYADINLGFRILIDAFAVDMLRQKGKFEVYYQVYSAQLKRRLFVILEIGEHELVPSLSMVFKNIIWYEREIFDMFGIKFSDHPDLRRILTSPMNDVFPLKKEA